MHVDVKSAVVIAAILAPAAWADVDRGTFAEKIMSASERRIPDSYDVTYYETVKPEHKSLDAWRGVVRGMYERTNEGATNKLGTPAGEDELEAEAQRIFREQDTPKRYLKRVRISEGRVRIDSATFNAEEPFSEHRPFDKTEINDGRFVITYDHQKHSALIVNSKGGRWGTYANDFANWFVCPINLRLLSASLFGKPSADRKTVERDEAKVAAFLAGQSPLHVELAEVDGKHRVEFGSKADPNSRTVFLLDGDDYAMMYECTLFKGSTPQQLIRQGSFNANGVPLAIRIEVRGAADEVATFREIQVLQVASGLPAIADATFSWAPPPGYTAVDRRTEAAPPAVSGGKPLHE